MSKHRIDVGDGSTLWVEWRDDDTAVYAHFDDFNHRYEVGIHEEDQGQEDLASSLAAMLQAGWDACADAQKVDIYETPEGIGFGTDISGDGEPGEPETKHQRIVRRWQELERTTFARSGIGEDSPASDGSDRVQAFESLDHDAALDAIMDLDERVAALEGRGRVEDFKGKTTREICLMLGISDRTTPDPSPPTHPDQPVIEGRFKRNRLVAHLLDAYGVSMLAEDLSRERGDEDWDQLAQLTGPSVEDYAASSYISDEVLERSTGKRRQLPCTQTLSRPCVEGDRCPTCSKSGLT